MLIVLNFISAEAARRKQFALLTMGMFRNFVEMLHLLSKFA